MKDTLLLPMSLNKCLHRKYLSSFSKRYLEKKKKKSHEEKVKEVTREKDEMLWKVQIPVVGRKELVVWACSLCRPHVRFDVESLRNGKVETGSAVLT